VIDELQQITEGLEETGIESGIDGPVVEAVKASTVYELFAHHLHSNVTEYTRDHGVESTARRTTRTDFFKYWLDAVAFALKLSQSPKFQLLVALSIFFAMVTDVMATYSKYNTGDASVRLHNAQLGSLIFFSFEVALYLVAGHSIMLQYLYDETVSVRDRFNHLWYFVQDHRADSVKRHLYASQRKMGILFINFRSSSFKWHCFDVFILVIGWIDYSSKGGRMYLRTLRLFRVIRILRTFKQLQVHSPPFAAILSSTPHTPFTPVLLRY
jgi:hypothetical protein